jgi:hypothetical protein
MDIDETACSKEAFVEKHGWAPKGEACITSQITINGRSFSVISAVSPLGFLCWEVFEGGISHQEFIDFLRNRVRRHVTPQTWCVIDNASIHHHATTTAVMNTLFNGAFYFSARYSPHLKPTETCFSMIKSYIRSQDTRGQVNPIQVINDAYELYRIGGQRAHCVMGHFNDYFANFNSFLRDFA